ncbi:MAG: large conductance mechanosensitive channel protein MscL [Ilumatobacteraceae bacterium]
MKKYLAEFKEFINKGDVVTIAVGLVMALYFKAIVDAVLEGLINPLIAALIGADNFVDIGFNIGDAPPPGEGAGGGNKDISIGLILNAIISFVAVAFFLFLVVKAYNKMKKEAEETAAGPTEIELLADIRDELRAAREPGNPI